MLVHLINEARKEAGGAQAIMHAVHERKPDASKIVGFDYIFLGKDCLRSSVFVGLVYLLMELFRGGRVFIIHHRVFLPLFFVVRRRVIFVCHNIFPSKNYIYRFMRGIKCVAVSDQVKEYLLRYNNALDVDVITNGLASVAHERWRRADHDGYDIGFVGRLEYQKGIDLLIEAFTAVRRAFENVDVRLHIVGEGSLKGKLEQMIANAGVSSSVKFYGYRDKPFELLRYADVICVPSRYEGFGLVFYEAVERNHLVVASDLPVLKVNNAGGTVSYFASESVDSLTEHLCSALQFAANGDLDIARRARTHGVKTVAEMVEQYYALMEG